MDMQLRPPRLVVNITEGLKSVALRTLELSEHPAIPREALQVRMALAIKVRTHLLDLKIGHITEPSAQCALMAPRPLKLKTLDQTALRKHLTRPAHNFAKTNIARENTHNMRAPGNPDIHFVFLGPELTLFENLEKLRMQRPLKKTECQFFNSNIGLR